MVENRRLVLCGLALAMIGAALLTSEVIAVTNSANATASTPYTLSFKGFDFDGALEMKVYLNGLYVATMPTVMTPQNAGIYVGFSVQINPVNGTNMLRFMHSNTDLNYPDYVKNVTVTSSTGQVIYSNSTAYPTVLPSGPTGLRYFFTTTVTGTSGSGSGSGSTNSTGTGTVTGKALLIYPRNFTLSNLVANHPVIIYLNLTNTGGAQATLNYTLNLGNLPGGSVMQLGACLVDSISGGGSYTINGTTTTNLCTLYPGGLGLSHILPAGYVEVLALTITPGPAAMTGQTYTFGVTVRGS